MRDIVWWWRRAASRGRPRSDGCARHVGLGMLHLPSPSRPRLVPRIRANESLGTSSRACARTRELARAQQIRDLVLNLEAVLARESVEKTTVCSFSCFYFAVSYVLPLVLSFRSMEVEVGRGGTKEERFFRIPRRGGRLSLLAGIPCVNSSAIGSAGIR